MTNSLISWLKYVRSEGMEIPEGLSNEEAFYNWIISNSGDEEEPTEYDQDVLDIMVGALLHAHNCNGDEVEIIEEDCKSILDDLISCGYRIVKEDL